MADATPGPLDDSLVHAGPPTPASTPRPSPARQGPADAADLDLGSPLSSVASDSEDSGSGSEGNEGVCGAEDQDEEGGSEEEEESEESEEEEEDGPVRKGGHPTELWNKELNGLLIEAAQTIPHTGRRHYFVDGTTVGRYGLIGQYVRRRTGIARTTFQIRSRLKTVKHYAKDKNFIKSLNGPSVTRRLDRDCDWQEVLGPDCFPNTKPVAAPKEGGKSKVPRDSPARRKSDGRRKRTTGSEDSTHAAKRARLEQDSRHSSESSIFAPSTRSLFERSLTNEHFQASAPSQPHTSLFRGVVFDLDRSTTPRAHTLDSTASRSTKGFTPRQPPMNLSFAFSPPSLPAISTPALALSTAFSATPLLTSLLSAAAPARDPSLLVQALLDSGFSSTVDVVHFLSLDRSILAPFWEAFGERAKLGALDLAWVRKAFEVARAEVAAV